MTKERLADVEGVVANFTIDRLAFTPNPPMVAVVVDFDGGGRFRCELTDVDPAAVAIGDRVEMTFRKVSTSQFIHNYFWKARPIREEA
jgi:Predicted nucleic-acid-binding protein containing a Zn-ribbon